MLEGCSEDYVCVLTHSNSRYEKVFLYHDVKLSYVFPMNDMTGDNRMAE